MMVAGLRLQGGRGLSGLVEKMGCGGVGNGRVMDNFSFTPDSC
jgi:hypothetical protein